MLKHRKSGYTIIETMIAISVFLIVVTFGMSALLNANLLHQKSQDMRSIVDNLSFVMDDISKNLKTGSLYQCFRKDVDLSINPGTLGVPRSCANGWAIAFESQAGDPGALGDQWAYYLDSFAGVIYRSTDGAVTFTRLTLPEIKLDSIAGFSVLGAEPSPGNQQEPLVTIILSGRITYKNVVTPFSIQTSISQRLLDIQ